MTRPMNGLMFRLMAWEFRIKARRSPPEALLSEARVRAGERVLDFGCGPGRYTIPAARLAGPNAQVYALDIHPLAFRYVRNTAVRAGVQNVVTVQGGEPSEIEAGSIDLALLYDTLHDIADPLAALGAIRRALRPGGRLSFTDHHIGENEAIALLAGAGFRFERRGERTLTFVKAASAERVRTT